MNNLSIIDTAEPAYVYIVFSRFLVVVELNLIPIQHFLTILPLLE